MTGAMSVILAVIVACFSAEVAGVTDRQFQELSAVVGQLTEENLILKEMLLNNTIEERVILLEIQMADVHEDISELEEDVAILVENDNFLFDEQIIQDERLFQLETETEQIEEEVESVQALAFELDFRVTVLEENVGSNGNSSISELEERVETLEGTAADHETRITDSETEIEDLEGTTDDHETRLTAAEENIQGLQMTDISLDARITALEETGGGGSSGNATIAFHTGLTESPTISEGSTVVFNDVLLNVGDGYDDTTGVFTVPAEGGGLYYCSTYLLVYPGEYAWFDIRVNDENICGAYGQHNDPDISGLHQQAMCSGLAEVVEGDEIEVVYYDGTDTTPLGWSTASPLSGFNGFRI